MTAVTDRQGNAVAGPSDVAAEPRPLVVDLDQTLVRTDTLHEAIVDLAFRAPAQLVAGLCAVRHGKAALKRRIARIAPLDCRTLPYDAAVLDLIADRRAQGGEVHLVTGADQIIADNVAQTLDIFDSATGSTGRQNLIARTKAVHLSDRFPDGFDYVGDSAADLPVWRIAGRAIIAGSSRSLAARTRRSGLETRVLPRAKPSLRQWVKALRLHQWSKNLLVFVPLVLSHEYLVSELAVRVAAAWLLFGLTASATYLINDLCDLAADRAHPTKRFRALAAGLIPISTAVPLAFTLLATGLAGTFALHPGFGLTVAAYVALTLLYSFKLKNQPMIDVATIAALFALRITAGMVSIAHPISHWLVTFTAVLFLSLALAKRTTELVQASRNLRPVKGRGYLPGDEVLTLALGIASGIVSVVVMVLYMSIEAMPTGLYVNRAPLMLIPAILGLWLMRIWLLAHRGTLNDDPVFFALRDRVSWLHAGAVGALWAVGVGGAW